MPIATTRSVSLAYEVFGSKEAPAIFLVMGAMNPGLFWPESFCDALATAGFQVIRYDQRDTGSSTKVDYTTTPYSLADLANDLIELADALRIRSFHLVGLSLGGAVAQIVASQSGERCLSLTLISSTVDSRPYNAAMAGTNQDVGPLSPPDKSLVEYAEVMRESAPTSEAEILESIVEGWRLFYGDNGFPGEDVRRRVERARALEQGSTSSLNHALAALVEETREAYVEEITCPTLILHGTEDKAFGVDHAKYSQTVIKNSKLMLLEGVGHMPDEREFIVVSQQILREIGKCAG